MSKREVKATLNFVREKAYGGGAFTTLTVRFSAPKADWSEETVNGLYLRDLALHAQVSRENDWDFSRYYGFEFSYRNKYGAKLRDAERMVKTLRRLERAYTRRLVEAEAPLDSLGRLRCALLAAGATTWEISDFGPESRAGGWSEFPLRELTEQLPKRLAGVTFGVR